MPMVTLRSSDREAIEAEIERIRSLGLDELRTLWRTTLRGPLPGALNKDLLIRSLCWDLQEQAFGGIDPATEKLLAGLGRGHKTGASRRRTRACCFAVHLRHELRVHDLVELLPARATRHLRRECLRIGKNLVHVGVPADDHLRLAVAQHVERRPLRLLGHMPVCVRFELDAAKINVDDVALVQIRR